jgi:hypothetical protein
LNYQQLPSRHCDPKAKQCSSAGWIASFFAMTVIYVSAREILLRYTLGY